MSRMATYASEEGLARDPNSPRSEEDPRPACKRSREPLFPWEPAVPSVPGICLRKISGGMRAHSKSARLRSKCSAVLRHLPGQGEDTIVRVGAREVRKRLAQYYVTSEGSASSILIELPPGSYAPEFRYAASVKEAHAKRGGGARGPVLEAHSEKRSCEVPFRRRLDWDPSLPRAAGAVASQLPVRCCFARP